jgi:acyl-CoA synthetase (AMP-forming)/AMP-acid ligase II
MAAIEPSSSVYERFRSRAKLTPYRAFLQVLPETAQAYAIEASEISYAEMLQRADRAAAGYAKHGIRMGDRVGLLLENRPAFVEHWLALNSLGASIVPINPDLRPDELSYIVGHAELRAITAVEQKRRDLEAAIQGPATIQIWRPEAVAMIEDPLTAPAPLDRRRECAVLYTSGTTGAPKGCILANEYFLRAGHWYGAIGGACKLIDGDRMLTPLPLFHMNALAYSIMGAIEVGGRLALLDRFHPKTWWTSVRESEAEVVHYLGVMPAILMKFSPTPRDRQHNVRFGFGAGVNRTLHAPFEERFGFPLVEAWAMSETGAGAVIVANHEPRKVGSNCFGRPSPQVEIRIVDDSGCDVQEDAPGELLVRAAGDNPKLGFFDSYLKDEAATEAAWAQGWFHTGDVVRRDLDGDLHFIDRRKNIIRRAGENIAAVEVEAALLGATGVAQVAVVAAPDSIREEEVLALVVPRTPPANARAAAHAIVRHCLDKLSYHKAPGYIVFVDALPTTATAKLLRAEAKRIGAEALAQSRAIDTRALKKRTKS